MAALLAACDDSTTKPSVEATPDPTLENIWPNDDGTAWTFELIHRTWNASSLTYYPAPEEVPPPPSLSEFADVLGEHAIGDSAQTALGIVRYEFDGEITTESGVTAQNLEETSVLGSGADGRLGDRLLARLFIARPDLRATILSNTEFLSFFSHASIGEGTAALACGEEHPVAQALRELLLQPIFFHGTAWVKTDELIGGYGDVDQELSWKYLEEDLSSGSEFTFQLVPSLADDVFLHVRILEDGLSIATEAGTFDKSIRCLWQIEYGIGGGDPMGYARVFDYGTATYAPTVGPIHGYERRFVETGQPMTAGIGELTLGLIGTSAGA